mgnify:CR=1 FL=1
MTLAETLKEKISQESLNQIPEKQEDGSFLSPAYMPVAVDVRDIINQEFNPNIQSDKSFQALQTSILNTGYTFPILIAENPLYNPDLDPADKPNILDRENRIVEVRDPQIRQYFKYMVVDGSHRLSAIIENKEIYEREDGKIPCIILRNKTSQELMSAEILMNSSRGNHTLDGMKKIVSDLIASGMDENWIAKNLYLDKEAIKRYQVLSGLASAFKDEEGFSKDVWDPKADRNHERKNKNKLLQLARAYVRKWRSLANADGGDFDIPEELDLLAAAKNIGFDEENPYVLPKEVDTETGEVLSTELQAVDGE